MGATVVFLQAYAEVRHELEVRTAELEAIISEKEAALAEREAEYDAALADQEAAFASQLSRAREEADRAARLAHAEAIRPLEEELERIKVGLAEKGSGFREGKGKRVRLCPPDAAPVLCSLSPALKHRKSPDREESLSGVAMHRRRSLRCRRQASARWQQWPAGRRQTLAERDEAAGGMIRSLEGSVAQLQTMLRSEAERAEQAAADGEAARAAAEVAREETEARLREANRETALLRADVKALKAESARVRSEASAAGEAAGREAAALSEALKEAERRDSERADEIKRLRRAAQERELMHTMATRGGVGSAGGVGLGPGAGFLGGGGGAPPEQ